MVCHHCCVIRWVIRYWEGPHGDNLYIYMWSINQIANLINITGRKNGEDYLWFVKIRPLDIVLYHQKVLEHCVQWSYFNSLSTEKYSSNFECSILPTYSNGWYLEHFQGNWPQDLTDDKSTLVPVMAWCCQANHYLNQCWLSFMSPYCITRGWWINMRKSNVF